MFLFCFSSTFFLYKKIETYTITMIHSGLRLEYNIDFDISLISSLTFYPDYHYCCGCCLIFLDFLRVCHSKWILMFVKRVCLLDYPQFLLIIVFFCFDSVLFFCFIGSTDWPLPGEIAVMPFRFAKYDCISSRLWPIFFSFV